MKKLMKLFIVITVLLISSKTFGQDSLVTYMAKKNLTTFTKEGKSFSGEGWNKIMGQAQASDFVLVGEDHFTNEIPYFFSALTSQIKFDNFFCEIDPYLANILQNNIKNYSVPEFDKYKAEYSNSFSFFSISPEFELLKKLVNSKTNIYGLDQIFLTSDRVICNDLQQKTKNSKAKNIYTSISDSSKIYTETFTEDHSKPIFYMFTDNFQKQLTELSLLDLSKEEKEIIEAMKLSAKIYKEQNHHLRIQLMKNQLMKINPEWSGEKNLFKFGAIHLAKGESLLKIYDIGNLVNNIADSKFKSTLNILIIEKSGTLGAPFGLPEQHVDENSNSLKQLKPIFKAVSGDQWHCFDLIPLREALENDKIIVKDKMLSRIIKGYDLLVIIPTVTAAKYIGIK
jgi:hypothetical protein